MAAKPVLPERPRRPCFRANCLPRLGLLKSYQYLYNATTTGQWLQRLPNDGAKHAISVGAFHGVTCT